MALFPLTSISAGEALNETLGDRRQQSRIAASQSGAAAFNENVQLMPGQTIQNNVMPQYQPGYAEQQAAIAQQQAAQQAQEAQQAQVQQLLDQLSQSYQSALDANESRYQDALQGYKDRFMQGQSDQSAITGGFQGREDAYNQAQEGIRTGFENREGAYGQTQDDIIGGYQGRYDRIMGNISDWDNQREADIRRDYDKVLSGQVQDAMTRGLYNTSYAMNLPTANEEYKQSALDRFHESQKERNAGYDATLSGDMLGQQNTAATNAASLSGDTLGNRVSAANNAATMTGDTLGQMTNAANTSAGLSGDILGVIERREDQYPDIGMYMNLLNQLGSSGGGGGGGVSAGAVGGALGVTPGATTTPNITVPQPNQNIQATSPIPSGVNGGEFGNPNPNVFGGQFVAGGAAGSVPGMGGTSGGVVAPQQPQQPAPERGQRPQFNAIGSQTMNPVTGGVYNPSLANGQRIWDAGTDNYLPTPDNPSSLLHANPYMGANRFPGTGGTGIAGTQPARQPVLRR